MGKRAATLSQEARMEAARQALAEEWATVDYDDPEQVARFYRESKALASDLGEWHGHETRAQWTEKIVGWAMARGVKSVLDVGCGRGDDLRALGAAGLSRMRLHGVEPNTALAEKAEGASSDIASDIDFFEGDTFDMVLLVDVLEHLPNPQAFLDDVLTRVPVGGYLVEATGTTDIYNALHLRCNWGWLPDGQIRRAGFRQVDGYDRLHLWERYAIPPNVPTTQSLMAFTYRFMPPEAVANMHSMAQRKGWNIHQQKDDALITRARAIAVSRWWREAPDDVVLLVDADIIYHPADAERIVEDCRKTRSIVVGAYVIRSGEHLASRLYPGTSVAFAADAELMEIEYGATGFMAIHRDVVDAMVKTLPLCHPDQPWSFWPMFDCKVIYPNTFACQYLSEDWAFCELARDHGFKTYLDPRIRLGHVGDRTYRLEDMAEEARPPKHQPRILVRERETLSVEGLTK